MKYFIVPLFIFTTTLYSCKGNQNSPDSTEGTSSDTLKSTNTYTCPLHSDVLSDQKGQCPTCGMELEPMT